MPSAARRNWTFLTNHAAVLVCIDRNPGTRIDEVAAEVGISRRATQMIVSDLAEAGYIERTRVGRRNRIGGSGSLKWRPDGTPGTTRHRTAC